MAISFTRGSCVMRVPGAKPVTTPMPVQLSAPEFTTFILPHLSMPKRGPKGKLDSHRVFHLWWGVRATFPCKPHPNEGLCGGNEKAAAPAATRGGRRETGARAVSPHSALDHRDAGARGAPGGG